MLVTADRPKFNKPRIETDEAEKLYKDGQQFELEGDLVNAISLLEKAAEKGHARACLSLGLIYSCPKADYPVDLVKARGYLEQAAQRGEAEAFYYLGSCYYSGVGGVEKDVNKARELYLKSLELGYHPALAVVAAMYENGIGTPR